MRWYEHVVRKDEGEIASDVWKKPVKRRRLRERQRIQWRDRVDRDIRETGLRKENVEAGQMAETYSGNRPLIAEKTVKNKEVGLHYMYFL